MRARVAVIALLAIALVGLGGLGGGIARADRDHRDDDASAEWHLETRSAHAGVPFLLDLVIEGFDESPAPDAPKLVIAGAKVTPLGAAAPNAVRMTQIVNGHRTDTTRVTWTLRYRVEVDKEASVRVPAVTVTQGSKHATPQAGDIAVEAVPSSDDMKLELGLPDRPIFIGETTKATLTWLFRRDPADRPQFKVPLMDLDELTIGAPPVTDKQHAIEIEAGGKTLQLPYALDQTTVDGKQFNRLVVTFFIAPRKSGTLQMPAASVVASLAVGRPDFFGQSASRMFRATDVPRTLEVRPLPEQDRPASFAGAVGSQFSIHVATSRSVVQLGEPVDLAIQIKSDQPLDTLALARLDGEGGLPKDKFTVPPDPPTGELTDDGKTKTFKVTAELVGPATEIPAISFAYFDPKTRAYNVIKSDPIALSVKAGNIVGANDVVGAAPQPKPGSGAGAPSVDVSVGGAELALSSPADVDSTPLGGGWLWLIVGLLYAVPIGVLVARSWQLRTAAQREDAAEVRAVRRRVDDALAAAATRPARGVAGELVAAIRALARALERDVDDGGLLAKIETESFAPMAADKPLPRELADGARALVKRWLDDARARPASKLPRAAVVLALLVGGAAILAAPQALADGAPAAPRTDALSEGRTLYQQAMATPEASAKRATFSRAANALADAVRAAPDRPELLADWGNAALASGDVATATLAYRRALALDASNPRARRNLDWLRSRSGDATRAPTGAADTLFFFHQWTRGRRLVVGAFAFAFAILGLVPWAGRRRGWQFGVAALPLVVWLAMLLSIALEDHHADDAVVMDGVVLRAADAAGAPAATPAPLPRGAEVTIVERRDAWTKIRLSNGTTGWVPDGTVQRVAVGAD